MDQFLRRTQIGNHGEDDFDSYIRGSTVSFGNVGGAITWLRALRISGLASLNKFDLFSIPAMSAELERVFSQAKFTVTSTRNRMSDETLEIHELLRHWW